MKLVIIIYFADIWFLVDHNARIPVPNHEKCKQVEENGGLAPSCSNCAKYYDGRIDHDFSNDPCVYVSSHDKCYAKKYALDEEYEIDTSCGEVKNSFH